MNRALLLLTILTACADSPIDPAPMPRPRTVLSACGWSPVEPQLHVESAGADVTFPIAGQWNDHVTWTAAMQSWSKCAAPIATSCGALPTIPAWDITTNPNGSQTGPWRFVDNPSGSTSIFVVSTAWGHHESWITVVNAWATCADATNQ
jgi:hypothetical protein